MQLSNYQITELVKDLAWPVVALIALAVLLPRLRELTQFALNLNRLIDKSGDLATVFGILREIEPRLNQVNDQVAELKGMQEIIISSRDAGVQGIETTPASAEELKQMWSRIEHAWEEMKDAISVTAKQVTVKTNFMGSVGVSNTVDKLVESRAIQLKTAEKIKDLAGKWQWMFRTTTPKDEWLNRSVADGFVDACAEVRGALKAGR